MLPAGATIFKIEQTFFRADVDYAELHELLRKREGGGVISAPASSIPSRMLALKHVLRREAYQETRHAAEEVAESSESKALTGAQLRPGVVTALEASRSAGWWVVAASDFGKKAVGGFLEEKGLRQYMNMVVARSKLDEDLSLERLLRPVKSRLKNLAGSVYFCNSSREVAEAKSLGMKCFVLPSPVESFRSLYQAGPTGIILSMDEVPQLLALPNMKLPEPVRTAAKRRGKALRPKMTKT